MKRSMSVALGMVILLPTGGGASAWASSAVSAGIQNSSFEATGNTSTGKSRACGVGADWTDPQQRPSNGWPLVKYDSTQTTPGPGMSYGNTGATQDHSADTAADGSRSMPFYSAGSSCASNGQAAWLGQANVFIGTSGLGAGTHVQYRIKAKGRSWDLAQIRPTVGHDPANGVTGPTVSSDLTSGAANTWLDIPQAAGTDDGDGLISVWIGARKNGNIGNGAYVDSVVVEYNAVLATTGPSVGGVTNSGAMITWATDESANTLIDYGTTPAFGSTAVGANGTAHTVTLTGLSAGTTYYFRAVSQLSGYAQYVSATGTFTTAASSSTPTVSVLALGSGGDGTNAVFNYTLADPQSDTCSIAPEYRLSDQFNATLDIGAAVTNTWENKNNTWSAQPTTAGGNLYVVGSGTGAFDPTVGDGSRMRFRQLGKAGANSSFSLRARIDLDVANSSTWGLAGIYVRQTGTTTATDSYIVLGTEKVDTTSRAWPRIKARKGTGSAVQGGPGDYLKGSGANGSTSFDAPTWYRIDYNASTSRFTCYWSSDGGSWNSSFNRGSIGCGSNCDTGTPEFQFASGDFNTSNFGFTGMNSTTGFEVGIAAQFQARCTVDFFEDATFRTASRDGSLGNPINGLSSSPAGLAKTFVWDVDLDLGTPGMKIPDAQLRITPSDAAAGAAAISAFFTLPAPACTPPSTPGAPVVSGATNTTLNVANNVADSGSPFFAFRINGGGFTNQFVNSSTGAVQASPSWATKAAWGTRTVIGLSPSTTYTFDVQAANDASGTCPSGFGATTGGTTSGSGNVPPTITNVSAGQYNDSTNSQHTYTLSDPESDTCGIAPTYRLGDQFSTTLDAGGAATNAWELKGLAFASGPSSSGGSLTFVGNPSGAFDPTIGNGSRMRFRALGRAGNAAGRSFSIRAKIDLSVASSATWGIMGIYVRQTGTTGANDSYILCGTEKVDATSRAWPRIKARKGTGNAVQGGPGDYLKGSGANGSVSFDAATWYRIDYDAVNNRFNAMWSTDGTSWTNTWSRGSIGCGPLPCDTGTAEYQFASGDTTTLNFAFANLGNAADFEVGIASQFAATGTIDYFETDWLAATRDGSLGEPLSGLASSPAGLAHTFVWNTDGDIGFNSAPVPDAMVRLTPSDTAAGNPGNSPFFKLPAGGTLRSLTVKARKGGAITTPASTPTSHVDGAVVNIAAQAASGYVFTGWVVGSGASAIANWRDPSTTITMTSDAVLWATFSSTGGNLVSNGDFSGGLTGWTSWRQTAAGTVSTSVTADDEAALSITNNGTVAFNGGVWQQFSTGGNGRIITVTGYWRTPQPGTNMWAEVLVIDGPRTPQDGVDETDGKIDVNGNTALLWKNTASAGWSGSFAKSIPVPVTSPNKYQASFQVTSTNGLATIILKTGTSGTATRQVLFDNIEVRSVPQPATISGGALTNLPAGFSSRTASFPVSGAVALAQSPITRLIYACSDGGGFYRVDHGASLSVTSISTGISITKGRGLAFDANGSVYIVNGDGRIYKGVKTGGGSSSDTFTFTAGGSGPPAVPIVDLPGPDTVETFHDVGGMTFNAADGKLYINYGSETMYGYKSNGTLEVFNGKLNARIVQFSPDDLSYSELAGGIRNSFGLMMRRADATLWGVENGPNGGCDYAEEFHLIEAGKHYGFPYKYGSDVSGNDSSQIACQNSQGGNQVGPPTDPVDPAGSTRTAAWGNYGPHALPSIAGQPGYSNGGVYWGFHPHSSPNGGDVYEVDQMDPATVKFPPEFRDAFFVCRFGLLEPGYSDVGFDFLTLRLSEWDNAFVCTRFIQGMGRCIDALAAYNGRLYVLEYNTATTAGGSGSLGGGNSRIHEISFAGTDTTPLTCSISKTSADPNPGPTVGYAISFNKPVSNFVQGDITLGGTAPGKTLSGFTGSGQNYAVNVSGITGNGTVSISLAAGVATDASGNANTACGPETYTINMGAPPLLTAAVSRKTHAAGVGARDINIFSGATECRSAELHLANGSLTIVATFDRNIALRGLAGGDVTTDTGNVSSLTPAGASLTVGLTNVPHISRVNLAFPGVADAVNPSPATSSSAALCVEVAIGDYNSGGSTNFMDFFGIQSAGLIGQNASVNPRADFNLSGIINYADFYAIKAAGLLDSPTVTCP